MLLEGEVVILRAEVPEDMKHLADLRNDLETQAWSKTLPPDYTEDMYMQRYNERKFSFDRKEGRFTIETRANNEFAGTISYTGLQPRWETTIGIVIPKKFWGSGVAYDAQEVMLKFLFEELGLQVVRLFTHSGNPRAVGLAEQSGFKVSVRRRESIYKSGELCDNLMMDLLREEYYELHPEFEDNLPGFW